MAIRINNQNYNGDVSFDGSYCPYGLVVRCRACRCVDFEQTYNWNYHIKFFKGTWDKILFYSSCAVILATIFEIAGFYRWIALMWGG